MNETLTPRVDAACENIRVGGSVIPRRMVNAEYARQIERELAAKHEEACILQSQVDNNDVNLKQVRICLNQRLIERTQAYESREIELRSQLTETRAMAEASQEMVRKLGERVKALEKENADLFHAKNFQDLVESGTPIGEPFAICLKCGDEFKERHECQALASPATAQEGTR